MSADHKHGPDEHKHGDDELELDCSAVIADIWLVLDNECNQDSRARLQHHLDTCSSCLAQYGLEEQIKSLLSRKCGGDKAPEGLRQRLSFEFRRTVIVQQTDIEG